MPKADDGDNFIVNAERMYRRAQLNASPYADMALAPSLVQMRHRFDVLRYANSMKEAALAELQNIDAELVSGFFINVIEKRNFYRNLVESGEALLIDPPDFTSSPLVFAPILAFEPVGPAPLAPLAIILGLIECRSPDGSIAYLFNIIVNNREAAIRSTSFISDGHVRGWFPHEEVRLLFRDLKRDELTAKSHMSSNYGDWPKIELSLVSN